MRQLYMTSFNGGILQEGKDDVEENAESFFFFHFGIYFYYYFYH